MIANFLSFKNSLKLDKNIEKRLRENMESKNITVYESTFNLIRKGKKTNYRCVLFLEVLQSAMYDFSLIDNLKNLQDIFSNRDSANLMLVYY